MKTRWLDRRIAAPGPFLALCLSQEEFDAALKDIGVRPMDFIRNDHSDATAHYIDADSGFSCVVCMRGYEGRSPIEVAGLLVHEAVHIWQVYAERLGEESPGAEQEAYAIQCISQELMAEFARKMSE